MAYSYGIRNKYRPTTLAPNAFGWSSRPPYNRADVPTALATQPGDLTADQFRQQFAYEWFQSNQLGGDRNLSNPPFVSGAAGRLHPALRDAETGAPARILRGYIRRAEFQAGDPMSRARLYFMYNPATITRDYVSYLNQSALDPFNTVYQSGNLVAPPSILDFSFSLFFDRQEEATQADHPGVFVDYQFFDLVVRNVIPSDPNQADNTIPDNGVMMVNPRDITVVFSPQLTVQGRPTNATVQFEKFTHRMTPTRMTINLQMRAVYLGPVKDMVEYKKELLQAEAAIPYGEGPVASLTSFLDNELVNIDAIANIAQSIGGFLGLGGGGPDVVATGAVATAARALGTANDGNHQIRLNALQYAYAHTQQGGPGTTDTDPWTDYTGANAGSNRWNLPAGADCSGLVTECYIKTGQGAALGWNSHPSTHEMINIAQRNQAKFSMIPLASSLSQLLPGDILLRAGHVAFYVGKQGSQYRIFDASGPRASPEVGERTTSLPGKFVYLLRPTPLGSTSSMAATSVWNDPSRAGSW